MGCWTLDEFCSAYGTNTAAGFYHTRRDPGNMSNSDGNQLGEVASLGEQLASRLRERWLCGERPLAEEFLDQHIELRQSPQAAIEVIYEEFCLRQAAGESNVGHELLQRFSEWREPLQVMMDCHQLLLPGNPATSFPVLGETIGGFRLISEIGRGARGRAYLGTQTELAGRPVVLKLAPIDGTEHLLLARLQHTNIVPVYSVSDDTDRGLRILCMPYFGCATLASLLTAMSHIPFVERSGQQILNALDQLNELGDAFAQTAAARQILAHVSYVEAACWVTACLADALQYAHEHNLVHFDVKPSNVLLASDGQPMLLDFHLAREPIGCDGVMPDRLGGTLGYMPPEQEAAMRSLSSGKRIESPVDRRADLFALGSVLYELLVGAPASQREAPPEANQFQASRAHHISLKSPHISAGLAGIVAKCLAPLAANRYVSAAALADDLRRHLTDQPLIGAPNRSWTERWRKWSRRRRHSIRITSLLMVVLAAVALSLAGLGSHVRQRSAAAEQALFEGQFQLQQQRPDTAVATFERGLSELDSIPFRRELVRKLRDELVTARRLIVVKQLHQLGDQVRVLSGLESLPSTRLLSLSTLCDEFWNQRVPIVQSLNAERDSDVATDLLDVAMFGADLKLRLSPAAERSTARQAAIRTLDEAEALFGSNAVVDYQRRLYRGDAAANQITADPIRRSAWNHYALGRALLNSRQLDGAAQELRAAVAIDPAGLWPNFYVGLCAERMGHHEEAVAAFSLCIGAAPHLAGCFHNRAISYAAMGHTDAAIRDETHSIKLDPTFAASWLNRGILHSTRRDHSAAIADCQQALQHGADPATVTRVLEQVNQQLNLIEAE